MNYLLKSALILAFIVVILGAWTRLSDAGLSCPDWPTCYGQFIVPKQIADHYQRPLEKDKAWKELIHRYAAGLLGLLIIVITIITIKNKQYQALRLPAALLLLLVILQGMLGALTVTQLVHPGIVVMHLFGGFATASVIVLLLLIFKPYQSNYAIKNKDNILIYVVIIAVLVQIFLGGWMSANYAALSCGDYFPSCLGKYIYPIAFDKIFYWSELGVNYEYGRLAEADKIAIHLLHRIGALAVMLLTSLLIYRFYQYPPFRKIALLITLLLSLQISLGITNILASLPIWVATLHNLAALLLLLILIKLAYLSKQKK